MGLMTDLDNTVCEGIDREITVPISLPVPPPQNTAEDTPTGEEDPYQRSCQKEQKIWEMRKAQKSVTGGGGRANNNG